METGGAYENQGFSPSPEDSSQRVSVKARISPLMRHGSIVPDQVYYSWKDINVTTKAEGGRLLEKLPCVKKSEHVTKQIVKNVSGMAKPGEILVIMGASGAGKTTLLNVLTFRKTDSLNVTGTLMVNGMKVEPEMFTLLSAYIQQDDVFIGTLTPREHLRFQALLRLDRRVTYKERMERVEEVIQEMGLSGCADTIIGIPGRVKGISGGQQKRLSVASEIITDPSILICDEPTTGLDSFMAMNLVKTLKSLASQGKTIICTIHQPGADSQEFMSITSEIFVLFDRLLLMSEGRVAYYGGAQQATSYFSTIGYPCPENYNPADFFIHTLAIKHGKEELCLARSKEICDKYEESENARELLTSMTKVSQDEEVYKSLQNEAKQRKVSPYKVSWFAQFRACFWRSGKTILKDPMVLRVQLGQTIFISLVIGIIYFGQNMDQDGIQNISGCIFIILANLTMTSIFPVTNVFWQELPVFLRDHFNGMYRTDAYYMAKTLADLPVFLCLPALYMSIAYYMIGLNPDVDRFFVAIAIAILVSNVGASFGYMASTITGSFDETMALGPIMIMPFMLFGGTFLNKDSIPVYFIWLKYLSWFLHGNEAFSVNQWRGVTNITCDDGHYACIETGEQVLEGLNFKEDNFFIALAALGGLIVGTRFISFLGLALKTRRS